MARDSKAVLFILKRLHWDSAIYAGGDLPSLVPYIWTVFFKIDGSTVRVNAGETLSGNATVVFTPGSHGDLGDNSLQVGQGVDILSPQGWWSDVLQPIPVDPSVQSQVGEDVPAFFGAVAVALSWEHVTDQAAEAGHQALNAYVQSAINQVVANIGPAHPLPTPADIDSFTAGAADAIASAVEDAQSDIDNIWSWFAGADEEIGSYTWLFNQDMFPDTSDHMDISQPISVQVDRWGAWGIDGTLDVTDRCPAGTSLFVLQKQEHKKGAIEKIADGMAAMRSFRDLGRLRAIPGLGWWWDRATTHTAELAKLLRGNETLRSGVGNLLAGMSGVLRDPDAPIPKPLLDELLVVLAEAGKSGSRLLALDSRRAARIVEQLHGKSLHGLETVLAQERLTTGGGPRGRRRDPKQS